MENPQLRQLLQQVQAELHHVQALDPSQRQQMESLQQDIQTLLTRVTPEALPPLQKRLTQSLEALEVSHPRLTLVLEQVIDALVSIGV